MSKNKVSSWTCKCGNTSDLEGFRKIDMSFISKVMDSNIIICERCGEIDNTYSIDIIVKDKNNRKQKLSNLTKNEKEEDLER